MKELSIEEKAKHYDEAIKVAQRFYNNSVAITKKGLEDIFPELKESEDEKTRKSLIILLQHFCKGYRVPGLDFPVSYKDMLAWLEKQSHVNEFIISQHENKMCKESEDEEIKEMLKVAVERTPWMQNKKEKCYEWLEKQGKQKPAELPKGEDYGIDGLYAAIDILQKTLGEVDGYQSDDGILTHKCAISAVKELSKQKPAEWSEEDREMRMKVLKYLSTRCSVNEYEEVENWLKSLRTQSKNITSKEFEEVIREIKTRIAQCNGFNRNHREEVFSLLDTLRPQNWKPSEEQLEVLWAVAEKYLDSDNEHVVALRGKVLESLYNDLKKLTE